LSLTTTDLAAAFPGGVTQPFSVVLQYRKSYSAASNETLFALSAGSSAGGTNLLALRTKEEAEAAVVWLRGHPRLGRTSSTGDVSYAVWPHPIPVVRTADDLRVISARAANSVCDTPKNRLRRDTKVCKG
jgi:hypothetical protein